MKILHVVDTLNPEKGGVSHAVRTMASEITRLGFNTEVVTLDKSTKDEDFSVYKIYKIGPSKKPWGYAKALTPWLLNNLHRFDVVIVHGLWLYSGFAVSKVVKKIENRSTINAGVRPPKLYFMPHGMLDPYFQTSNDRKIKAIRNWIYWKLIEGKLINNASGLLFTCKQECILAKEPFSPYRPNRELIVGLGVIQPPAFKHAMLDAFYSSCPEVKNSNYLLFIGRIDQKKGVDVLIKAYKQLLLERAEKIHKSNTLLKAYHKLDCLNDHKEYPKLVIAGPGLSTDYGKKIKQLVDESDLLTANVFFPGMLESERKWGAFYGSEAFVLPSHQENFGIAVVEALGCGKPVLISQQVNINNEIAQDQAGLVEDDTIDGTLRNLKMWVSRSEYQRVKMGERSKMCFKKHFAIDAATHRLVNAIS
jgi:glycosyltransferase involved in cell wall biosynthesis